MSSALLFRLLEAHQLVELGRHPKAMTGRSSCSTTVPIEMAQNGAGSLNVGPGWDGGFVALDLYLRGETSEPAHP